MKLHAFNSQFFLLYSHDLIDLTIPGLGPGRDFQAIRKRILVNDQGMVTGRSVGIAQTLENIFALVMHQ